MLSTRFSVPTPCFTTPDRLISDMKTAIYTAEDIFEFIPAESKAGFLTPVSFVLQLTDPLDPSSITHKTLVTAWNVSTLGSIGKPRLVLCSLCVSLVREKNRFGSSRHWV